MFGDYLKLQLLFESSTKTYIVVGSIILKDYNMACTLFLNDYSMVCTLLWQIINITIFSALMMLRFWVAFWFIDYMQQIICLILETTVLQYF